MHNLCRGHVALYIAGHRVYQIGAGIIRICIHAIVRRRRIPGFVGVKHIQPEEKPVLLLFGDVFQPPDCLFCDASRVIIFLSFSPRAVYQILLESRSPVAIALASLSTSQTMDRRFIHVDFDAGIDNPRIIFLPPNKYCGVKPASAVVDRLVHVIHIRDEV